MRLALASILAGVIIVGSGACEDRTALQRQLASFEVTITSPTGSDERRCPLPGTPTKTFDLTGCPTYTRDSSGRTVVKVQFEARAIDNRGEFYPEFNGLASVRIVPGEVEAAFKQVRFSDGKTKDAVVSYRAAFGDTFLWVVDELPPPRALDVAGLGVECGFDADPICAANGLTCVNTKPEVGFDPAGLAYCTRGCSADTECPDGYFCGKNLVAYGDAASDTSNGACMRRQPSFSIGAAGPMHLVEPTLADISRSDSLIQSPFEERFIQVERGKMVVTAVRIDGFYLTDVCPIAPANGGPTATDIDCTDEDRSIPAEFNHLFVFNFSRPDDLYPGDKILTVSGPMTEFVGLTEMAFPFWEVDFCARTCTPNTGGPDRCPFGFSCAEQSGGDGLCTPIEGQASCHARSLATPVAVPKEVNLHDRLIDHYPDLLRPGAACFLPNRRPEQLALLDCPFAMERLEGARIAITAKHVIRINRGSREEDTLEEFGQWPITVDTPLLQDMRFNIVTRENIPFFDPLPLGGRTINQTVIGNLRQVAFDDRSDPIWIVEPRDQNDCRWCTN